LKIQVPVYVIAFGIPEKQAVMSSKADRIEFDVKKNTCGVWIK
jgi:hypothetical protein